MSGFPWIIITALFAFAFIYVPLRSSRTKPVIPSQRRQILAAAIGAVLVAVGVFCVMALR